MNWFKRKPRDVIPNPRDKRRRQDAYEAAQVNVLRTTQFLVFSLAIMLLLAVS